MRKKSYILIITFVFMLTTLLSGCTGNDSVDKAPEAVSEAKPAGKRFSICSAFLTRQTI